MTHPLTIPSAGGEPLASPGGDLYTVPRPQEIAVADIKDVSTVVASALNEIGVSGTLDVAMGGGETVSALSPSTGDDVEVVVTVRPIEKASDAGRRIAKGFEAEDDGADW